METQSNFNPIPAPKPLWTKYGRKIGLALAGLVIASMILFVTGSFDKLSRIFGIGASTTQTVEFFGDGNLRGGASATEPHVVVGTNAVLENADIVVSADNVPDHNPAGTIVPETVGDVCIPETDCTFARSYVSPALDLGSEATLDTVRIEAFIPDEATSMSFSYRTASELSTLEGASFATIETSFNPDISPEDELTISNSTTILGTVVSQYLQFRVEFNGGATLGPVPSGTPAVYGWSFDYTPAEVIDGGGDTGDDPTDGTGDTGDDATVDTRSLVIHTVLLASPPLATSVELVSAETRETTTLATNLNMSTLSTFDFDLPIDNGAYAVVIRSTTHETGVVAALIESDITHVYVPAMDDIEDTCPQPEDEPEPEADDEIMSADLNSDGQVNASDYAIFISQWESQG